MCNRTASRSRRSSSATRRPPARERLGDAARAADAAPTSRRASAARRRASRPDRTLSTVPASSLRTPRKCCTAPGRSHVTQIERSAPRSIRRREVRMRPQRLQLRGEQNGPSRAAVVERLLAHAIANEPQRAAFAIPQRESRTCRRIAASAARRPSVEIAASMTSVSEWPRQEELGGMAPAARSSSKL